MRLLPAGGGGDVVGLPGKETVPSEPNGGAGSKKANQNPGLIYLPR